MSAPRPRARRRSEAYATERRRRRIRLAISRDARRMAGTTDDLHPAFAAVALAHLRRTVRPGFDLP